MPMSLRRTSTFSFFLAKITKTPNIPTLRNMRVFNNQNSIPMRLETEEDLEKFVEHYSNSIAICPTRTIEKNIEIVNSTFRGIPQQILDSILHDPRVGYFL